MHLYYGHDPMCSFCWAYRPVWAEIQEQVVKRFPDIEIVYLMGGLAPDSDQPMSTALKDKLMATWRYIQQNIPGTEFNYDFWSAQQPRRSTYPACRAVMAAKMLGPQWEQPMILAIQRAYYLDAQNPSNEDTLLACAESIGLDPGLFTRQLHSPDCEAAFAEDRQRSLQLGINSFPSLIISKGKSRYSIPVDYQQAALTLEHISEARSLLQA